VRRPQPFDAVLLISFGGPGAPEEIRPFLANVLRGRQIPAARVEDVVHHYKLFDGLSPLTVITLRQAELLRDRLVSTGLPVYVGMRNWHPFLDDTLRQMSRDGVRRVLAFTLAAHHCYSSCGQYKQNVVQARETIRGDGQDDLEVTYVGGWHNHPGFIEANACQIEVARDTLAPDLRVGARVVFTAHSIPSSMAAESRYVAELKESATLVAERLATSDWDLVYQSRSGRPQDPWLEPDICDYLRTEHAKGLTAVVVSPLGFVADHIEVLYDLDTEATQVSRELGLAMGRASAVNDHPSFLDMMADVVETACQQYFGGMPLPIVPKAPPPRTELPPPVR
jgi:ferrochelatase